MPDPTFPVLANRASGYVVPATEWNGLLGPLGGLAYVQAGLDQVLTNAAANGAVTRGALAVLDLATPTQVVLTTTAVDARPAVVAQGDVAAGALGAWRPVGLSALFVTGLVNAGDRLCTSTVAGRARAATAAEPAFGRAVTSGGSGQVLAALGADVPVPGLGPLCVLHATTDQSLPNNTLTPIAFDSDDDDPSNMHFTSAAALTGTVAKTAASAVLVGTGTSFVTELSLGQVIDVPGGAVERRQVTAITDATHVTVQGACANTASGQVATRVNSAIAIRATGFYQLYGLVTFAPHATGNRAAYFRINPTNSAVLLPAFVLLTLGAAGNTNVPVTSFYRLVQGDVVELLGHQTSGGALSSLGSATTFFNAPYLAALRLAL